MRAFRLQERTALAFGGGKEHLATVRMTATDADLAVVTFSYSAIVPGNVSAEVVKYFLQLYYDLDQDLRLDPNDFSLVTAN